MKNEIEAMIQHCLRTPENGYLGSSYGINGMLKMLVASNDNFELKEEFIEKLRSLFPILHDAVLDVCFNNSKNTIKITVNNNVFEFTT